MDYGFDHESNDDQEIGHGLDIPQSGESYLDHTIDTFLRPIVIEDATLYQLACRFSQVYRELCRTSDQQFLPTPVTRLPSGQETGRYLAIDVGGSNLRVAFVELLGESDDQATDVTNTLEKSRDTILKAQRQRVRRTLDKTWPIGE